jgi:hypothetical protein
MTDPSAESSPRRKARLAGLLYWLEIAGNVYAIFVLSSLVVRDDAAATAANILASEPLFRFGFAADLIAIAAYVGVTAILYDLLKPVSRNLPLFAAFFGLAGAPFFAASQVNHLAPLFLFKNTHHLTSMTMSVD